MTAPDPRLKEIEGRRDPEGCTAHDDCLRSDVAYLLAELRKAQYKLGRVERIAASMDRIADFNLSILPHDDMGVSLRQHAEDLRAAVADATGGGE